MSSKSSPTKKKSARPKVARPKAVRPASPAPFTTDDPRAAWQHFRAEALKANPATLAVCTADADLVRVNVARGVASVTPLVGRARVELPATNVTRAVESAALSLALTHAVDLIGNAPAPESAHDELDAGLSLSERTARMFADRQLLMLQLKVFVGLGDFSQSSMTALLQGTGPIDGARDVLSGNAALDGEKIAGRHPFTAKWRSDATKRARRLLSELSPADATPEAAVRDAASIERDAYWALLVAAHAELRKIGMVLFGEKDLDAKVPPLMARTAGRAEPKAPPAPPA